MRAFPPYSSANRSSRSFRTIGRILLSGGSPSAFARTSKCMESSHGGPPGVRAGLVV
jgi:hypothetical protein